jgi:hypothetical protein
VQKFPLLIVSRSPVASRAPANYELAERTSEFEVFKRVRPASEIFVHFPLSGSPVERTRQFCAGLTTDVRRAGTGASVAYVQAPSRVSLIPTQVSHPSYWHAVGPEALHAYGSGAVEGTISLPTGGTYEVAMPGSEGRPLTLYVDGRRVGGVAYQDRYPGQFLRLAARVTLSAGTHRVRLSRGNGNLHPGSGDGPDTASGVIGPLIFALQEAEAGKLKVVPGSDGARVCAAHVGYQWMEVLRPGALAGA